jgi:hypothetical protein
MEKIGKPGGDSAFETEVVYKRVGGGGGAADGSGLGSDCGVGI